MKHAVQQPVEVECRKVLDDVRRHIVRYEARYLDGDDRDDFLLPLKQLHDTLCDLLSGQFADCLDDQSSDAMLSESQRENLAELKELQRRIDALIMK